MNLLADESVDRQIVERLRVDGYEVLYIAEVEPSVSDMVVFERANEKTALLVTADKDFGEIVFRDKKLVRTALCCFGWRVYQPRKKLKSCRKHFGKKT